MVMWTRRQRDALVAFAAFVVGVGFVYLTRTERILALFDNAWYEKYRDGIDAIAVLLGVVGLVLTLRALALAKHHEEGMRTLVEKLGTQLLGKFPDPLGDIAQLIDGATEGDTIDILADCADYGSFFAPTQHGEVFHAIGRASTVRHVTVRMLMCGYLHHITHNSPYWEKSFSDLHNDPTFRKHLDTFLTYARDDGQFKDWLERHATNTDAATDFLQWLNKYRDPTKNTADLPAVLTATELHELLTTCLEICRDNKEPVPSDGPAFTLLLLCREKYFEGLLRTVIAVDFRRFTDQTNLFFWMKSRRGTPLEAAFTYVDAGDETRGLVFRTKERELLKVFRSTFNKPRTP
jgi:hypothetical protein